MARKLREILEKVDLKREYRAGLSDKTAAARKAHWKKMDKLSDNDPRAYEPAPGDETAKTKLSKHTIKYRKMYGEEVIDEAAAGLAAKAKKSGVSLSTLKTVYRRGVAAWNSGHRPGTTPQQWGMARVNSYITKGKGTYHGADKDLREDDVEEACWTGYAQRGMKKKGDRMVPNCVPVKENFGAHPADSADRAAAAKQVGRKMAGGQSVNPNPPTPEKSSLARDVLDWTPLGAAFSAKDAYDNVKKGEYGDAAIDAGIGVAQVFGGPIAKGVGKVIRKIGPARGAAAGLAAGTSTAGDVKEEDIQECNGQCSCGRNEVEEDKKGHKSPSGGLTQKGRDYYNRTTGSNLKAPVTTPPSKLKKGSKAANRRKSFCARMGGMKKRLTSSKTANDPDSRINKALRKWNC
jgi:hypothetical protein